jgi:hypothetical protein
MNWATALCVYVRARVKVEWRKPNIHYSQQMNNCTDIKSSDKNEIKQTSQKSEAYKKWYVLYNGMYYIMVCAI